jgi:hypothetical protein
MKAGTDIFIVGLAIIASEEISHAADEFIEQINKEEIDCVPDYDGFFKIRQLSFFYHLIAYH